MAFLPQTPRERLILFLLICLLAWIGLEIFMGAKYATYRDSDFRAFRWDLETLWRFKPSFRGKTYGHQVDINAQGFRGRDEYPLESKHALRIITLGDSRTYGFAVENDETFSAVMQARFREKGFDAEVINGGVHGYTSVQCRLRLKQLLPYKPDVIVFGPGYNDRRYLIFTPPDNPEQFKKMAIARHIVGFMQWSNVFFGFFHEVGRRKVKYTLENPPRLDEVPVRVAIQDFQIELRTVLNQCRQNAITPVFLKIHQNPSVFSTVEEGNRLYEARQYQEAIDLLEAAEPTMHMAALAYCRYTLGRCYEQLGNLERAQEYYQMHQPLGSMHGEAILRPQADYFRAYEELALSQDVALLDVRDAIARVNEHLDDPLIQQILKETQEDPLPLVDGSEAKPLQYGQVKDIENFFRARFTDECHYDKGGHRLVGLALAEMVGRTIEE